MVVTHGIDRLTCRVTSVHYNMIYRSHGVFEQQHVPSSFYRGGAPLE